jgi:hypothetical protein
VTFMILHELILLSALNFILLMSISSLRIASYSDDCMLGSPNSMVRYLLVTQTQHQVCEMVISAICSFVQFFHINFGHFCSSRYIRCKDLFLVGNAFRDKQLFHALAEQYM